MIHATNLIGTARGASSSAFGRFAEAATRTQRRSAITLVIAFWLMTFAILSIRGAIVEPLPFATMAPRRGVIAVVGAILCWLAALGLERVSFRSFAHRLLVGFAASIGMAILFTVIHTTIYRTIMPIPGVAPLTAGEAAAWVLTWLGYMMAWTGIYLALVHHWQVSEHQAQASAMRDLAQESKIAALRYQINPHFLFNALNSIAALVQQDEKDGAEAMIVSLADFFRATLSSSPSQTVTLAQEIELQLLYLRIERTRFAGRMKVRTKISASLLLARVPQLILQPLVENAIRHGVELSEGVTEVEIGASANDENLLLYVENRTSGARAQRDGSKVGLQNVADRLRAQYGDRGQLSVDQRESSFRASILLPMTA